MDLSGYVNTEPESVLFLLMNTLLGLVGISAAIAVLVAVLRHYLSDDSETATPSLQSFGRVGGFVLIMAALAGFSSRGGLTGAFIKPENAPDWTPVADPATGWMPQNIVTQQAQGTLGETLTKIGLAAREQYDSNVEAVLAKNHNYYEETNAKISEYLEDGKVGKAAWTKLKQVLKSPSTMLKLRNALRNDIIDKAAEEKAAADSEAGKRELRITNDKASLKDYFDQFLYNHYKLKRDKV